MHVFVVIAFIILLFCIYFFNRSFSEGFDKKTEIGIVSMIRKPKNIEIWLQLHRTLGIKQFYIRLEDTPEKEDFLKQQQDVFLEIGKSSGKNEYSEMQTRQTTFVDSVIKMAFDNKMDKNQENNSETNSETNNDKKTETKIDWLIHINADDVLEGDLDEIRQLPDNVRTFWMHNMEAMYGDIPTAQTSCFKAAKFVDCSESDSKCVGYVNGKGGCRIGPDVASNGPHRFKSSIVSNNQTQDNETEIILRKDQMVVKHYESCDFEAYKTKFEQLAKETKFDENKKNPSPYYNDSITAAKTGDETELEQVYRKYRVSE